MTSLNVTHDRLRREHVYFGGCDYLGMSQDESVKLAVVETVRTQGISVGAARLTSGNTRAHRFVETLLASATGAEQALVLPSGYLANVAVVQALRTSGSQFLCMANAHQSFLDHDADGSIERFTSYAALVAAIGQFERQRVPYCVCLETVDPVTGQQMPYETVQCVVKTGYLVLDESHSFGLTDPSQTKRLRQNHIITSSLSKAIGMHGGFIAASAEIIERVIERSGAFRYATPLPPAICNGITRALALCRAGHSRRALMENVQRFRAAVPDLPQRGEQSHPVYGITRLRDCDAATLHKYLLEHGLFVPFIEQYGTSHHVLRIAIRANHTPAEVDQLANALLAV